MKANITSILLIVAFFIGCQSTHKIVVVNDLAREKPATIADSHTTHTVIGFINIHEQSYEKLVCRKDTWKQVTSEQAPIWSGLRVGADVARTATWVAGVHAPALGLLTVYSQFETTWQCGG